MKLTCPREVDVPAWLQGELDEAARRDLARHLEGCPACRARGDDVRAVLARLQSAPAASNAGLADRVLARRAAAAATVRPRQATAALRLAAVLAGLLLAGLAIWSVRERQRAGLAIAPPAAAPPERAAAVRAALDWLVQSQADAGCWDAEKWGAQKNFAEGVTALSLLALLEDGPGLADPRRGEAVRRAAAWLLTRQNERGLFGPDCTGSMYNHGLATLALLEACARERDGAWLAAAQRAVDFIAAAQKTTGGWGYLRAAADDANASVTVWQLQALIRAESLGVAGTRPAVERGLAWLEGLVDDRGRIGYSRAGDFPNGHAALTAAGALCLARGGPAAGAPLQRALHALREAAAAGPEVDYYRWYFLAGALEAIDDRDAPALIAQLRGRLLDGQVRSGPEAGSWGAGDRWTAAGGRVYATAMAVLALQ